VVPVALHQAFEAIQMLPVDAHEPVFVEYEHSQAVAGVEQFGRRRIVRCPDGVAPHLFEELHPVFLQPVRNGCSDPAWS